MEIASLAPKNKSHYTFLVAVSTAFNSLVESASAVILELEESGSYSVCFFLLSSLFEARRPLTEPSPPPPESLIYTLAPRSIAVSPDGRMAVLPDGKI